MSKRRNNRRHRSDDRLAADNKGHKADRIGDSDPYGGGSGVHPRAGSAGPHVFSDADTVELPQMSASVSTAIHPEDGFLTTVAPDFSGECWRCRQQMASTINGITSSGGLGDGPTNSTDEGEVSSKMTCTDMRIEHKSGALTNGHVRDIKERHSRFANLIGPPSSLSSKRHGKVTANCRRRRQCRPSTAIGTPTAPHPKNEKAFTVVLQSADKAMRSSPTNHTRSESNDDFQVEPDALVRERGRPMTHCGSSSRKRVSDVGRVSSADAASCAKGTRKGGRTSRATRRRARRRRMNAAGGGWHDGVVRRCMLPQDEVRQNMRITQARIEKSHALRLCVHRMS